MTAPTPNAMPGAAPAAVDTNGQGQQPAAPTAATAVPPTPAQPPAQPSVEPTPSDAQPDNRPPWEKSGEKFDPERAWSLIQNLRTENTQIKERTDPIVAEWEQLRLASQSDLERAQEDVTSITGERDNWRQQAVLAKAETLAAGKFIDAETALALIGDLSEYTGPAGIDVAKLTARLDQLAADKPFLVAAPQQPPGFTPNRAQGQSGTGQVPLDAQIKAAQDRGDVMASIALKQAKHYQTR